MEHGSGLKLLAPTLDEDIEREIDEDAAVVAKPERPKRKESPPTERKGRAKTTRAPAAAPRARTESAELPLERTKNFSSVRSDVVVSVKNFADAWRARYPRENPPKTKWLVTTMLSRFLDGDALAKVAARRLANLESEDESAEPGEGARLDFSFRASDDLIRRIEDVVTEWNSDELAPRVSHTWLFEAAYFEFVGEGDLVDQVAAALTETFRKRAAASLK